jgi:hypothetical protein
VSVLGPWAGRPDRQEFCWPVFRPKSLCLKSFCLKSLCLKSPRREFTLRRPHRTGEQVEKRSGKRFHFRRPRRRSPFQLGKLFLLVALLILVIFFIRYFGTLNR